MADGQKTHRCIELSNYKFPLWKLEATSLHAVFLFKGVNQEFDFGHGELETPKRPPGGKLAGRFWLDAYI